MAKTTPTLADLQAERARLDKEIAIAEISPLEKALAALTGDEISSVLAELEGASLGLADGSPKQSLVSVRQIVTAARNQIERALGNAQAKANDGATPPAGEASE